MANETIVSPGVFTRENDQSFLPQGIGQIGAAIVGPTSQGPAFVPIVIRNGFTEFQRRFGDLSPSTYIPQTVREYLKSAGSVTVVRVLAGGGYKFDGTNKQLAALVSTGSSFTTLTTSHPSNAVTASANSKGIEAVGALFSSQLQVGDSIRIVSASVTFDSTIESIVSNTALSMSDAFTGTGPFPSFATASRKTEIDEILTVFFPSQNKDNATALELGDSTAKATVLGTSEFSISSSFGLTLSSSGIGVKNITASLVTTQNDYIEQTLGLTGNSANSKTGANAYEFSAFPYLNFKSRQIALADKLGLNVSLRIQNTECTFTSSFAEGYNAASTPFITSQLDSSKNTTELFKFHTLADGTDTNRKYKISIANLKEPANIDGVEQYSQFSIIVREYGDTDKNLEILEQYNNVTLDPNDVNYISRRIGDRYAQYNETLGKVELKGNYPNISQFIRVEVKSAVEEGALSPKLSPKGFKAVNDTIIGFPNSAKLPSASFQTSSTDINGNFNTNVFLGWNFNELDNRNWNNPVPETAAGSNVSNVAGDFNVENFFVNSNASIGHAGKSLSASLDTTGISGPTNTFLKFSVPFQGGLDGVSPTVVPQIGEYISSDNLYGFDLSGTSKAGYKGYKKALDILSNQDEYDINMLALPGVIKTLHSSVTQAAIDMVEKRSDAFFVMDLNQVNDSINTAVNATDGLDSNYAAAYFPWVKVLDTSRNKPIFVPPSVVVPGAIAASDALQAEWFAPAGLNRGVLGNVLEARIRLSQSERDKLYEARINPIATFPQTGVCIWGQKTLQLKASALDRINVRRLLIAVKKFIASSSRFLLFEQNTAATRNRFLNIVNPFLESVQSRQGLFAFRVQMDESNNTAEVIDRNQLVGAIFLQPTKTAEFIVLDFNVLPTGASFGE
jgi:hypothetical protein